MPMSVSLTRCTLCPRRCGVDRVAGERGFCGAGAVAKVAAVSVHHGEEPPLSGSGGSGNIFFTGCNLACLFCQNYPISRLGVGRDFSVGEIAEAMLSLQARGVHNVNLVSPTPWVPHIIEALAVAKDKGFHLPLVYNSGGYEAVDTLRWLEGVVDIYLPDMKYASDGAAWRFSRVPRYTSFNRRAVVEMMRQKGPLVTDADGIATAGVLVRHLVLPGEANETAAVFKAMRSISRTLPLSLMYQYFPADRAVGHSVLGRRLWREECREAEGALRGAGLSSGWTQDYE
jgi:putative pyruvate formate lyase activating enzyme